MKKTLALIAALALLLTACAAPAEERSADDYDLYYAAALSGSNGDGGDAIRTETLRVENSASMKTAALAELLVSALLEAPQNDDLRSPFPAGTTLQKVAVAGGRAMVDLSEQYARLAGIDLSVADCCVALTLTQLNGVNAVHITANGRELPYRKTQLLTTADVLLSGSEESLRPINISLYFLDTQTGSLRAQPQTLVLYEGQSRVSAALEALLQGPESDDSLQALLPPDFAILSGRIDNGICYVNLSSRAALPQDEVLRELAIRSLAQTLLSLAGVHEAQFLVDGESMPQWTVSAMAQTEADGAGN